MNGRVWCLRLFPLTLQIDTIHLRKVHYIRVIFLLFGIYAIQMCMIQIYPKMSMKTCKNVSTRSSIKYVQWIRFVLSVLKIDRICVMRYTMQYFRYKFHKRLESFPWIESYVDYLFSSLKECHFGILQSIVICSMTVMLTTSK